MTSRRLLFLLPVSLLSFGCGGGGSPVDAGPDADTGVPLCVTDVDCDDGNYCNGAERCMHTLGADAHGCLPAATTACAAAQSCDEAARVCTTDCARAPDADGDGHAATTCSGDDCDDSNPMIHPGATEICDSAGVDEDCNPATLGGPADSDRDGDGHIANNCCDDQPAGGMLCGDDCADSFPAIHPGAMELCNGLDDNCNSIIDDGATRSYHVDADHDGYGDGAMTMDGPCTPPVGLSLDGADCDDTMASVHPGATEICDGHDENCNTVPDDGCPAGSVTLTVGATGPMPAGSGTIFFDDRCGAGQVLVGLAFATDAGGAPSRAGALCAPLTVASDTSATPYVLSAALGAMTALPEHGVAATTTPASCLPHEAVTSIGPGLVLGCGGLAISGHAGSFVLDSATDAEQVGPGTGEPAGMTFHCPPGSVGIAVSGYEVAGTFAITGMTCASVTLTLIPGT